MILQILTLLGAVTLFLFGLSLLSGGLQKVAGDGLRAFLASMTSNPFKQIITGISITAIIQSSTATTIMVVSFVNAGLLVLGQARDALRPARSQYRRPDGQLQRRARRGPHQRVPQHPARGAHRQHRGEPRQAKKSRMASATGVCGRPSSRRAREQSYHSPTSSWSVLRVQSIERIPNP